MVHFGLDRVNLGFEGTNLVFLKDELKENVTISCPNSVSITKYFGLY